MIAVDTGFFLALLDADDRHHLAAKALVDSVQEGWITSWPVVTETVYMLQTRLSVRAAIAFVQEIADGSITVWNMPEEALRTIPALMQRYATLPMDLADASLVLLAGHLGHGRILSTDVRDFGAYRFKGHEPFHNLLFTTP